MGLRLHNTLTRTKQDFVPIDPKNVRMYVCGPTVYDFAHIGNARPLIVFDVLFRLLRHLCGEDHVTYVRNITDVDDKINARAAQEYPDMPLNDAIRAVTEKTSAQFHADVDALGCLRPTHEPRATEYVERPAAPTDMIRMIADLIANGHAYAAEGHVLFKVDSMPDYGKLANRSLDDMIAGARVEVAPYKHGPMDFVLWKPSKPGEPAWPSPWSNGRPGWHIECSAMSGALLGDTFDIHGGGIDLIFPHHENEIAQSRCAHGTAVMANYWLHNGFLQVEGEKMSKSAGNFVTINELLATQKFGGRQWPGSVLRLAMLMTHYRQPIDWTADRLEEASGKQARWLGPQPSRGVPEKGQILPRVVEALEDDLNTAAAIAALDEIASRARASNDFELSNDLAATLVWLGVAITSDFQERRDDALDLRVSILLADRKAARAAKDFARADEIRKQLDAMGIALKDAKDPKTGELVTTWEVKR
jgi:cysteinyl-tRNA synthetase